MARFSQRMGYTAIKSAIQIDSMDDDLRNSLWNVILATFFQKKTLGDYPEVAAICKAAVQYFFKQAMDTMTEEEYGALVRDYFFTCKWYEVYDFIEFLAGLNVYERRRYIPQRGDFTDVCNEVLTREVSGYRFIGNQIVPITSDMEIQSIAEAQAVVGQAASLQPVAKHLQFALDNLADRKNPDYRTSMKEAISAVEALCKILAAMPDATLGPALKAIEASGQVALHSSLTKGFQALYGYTSDAAGIRHALKDNSTVDVEDATFMLVSCSAFVHYLVVKAGKAGIKL